MKPVLADTIDDAMKGPWFWMRHLVCERAEIIAHLGTAHWTVPEDGFLYDYDHWIFEAACGFRICYSFSSEGPPEGAVHISLPEDEHLIRHDAWCVNNTRLRNDEHFDEDIRRLIEYHMPTCPVLADLNSYQVWRMGDDGNEMPVGFPTSEIDARCHVAELESHKHKQIYWFRRCDKKAEPSDARKSPVGRKFWS